MFRLPVRSIKKDLLEYDLTEFPAVAYFTLIFLISRIPFINLGFSALSTQTDLDTLAVVNSAYLIRYDHVYTVSRFPGYPLYEGVNALLISGGWIATNMATVIISFICIILFAKILNIFKIKNKALLVFTFAFIPMIWINSVITMDYMWALMFIMLGSYLGFSGKYSLAGISIGLAVGSRFTSVFMVIPILYWAISKKVNLREILTFISTAVGTSIILFLPVFYRYRLDLFQGSGFLSTTPVGKPMFLAAASSALNNMVMELFGMAAFVFLIFFMILTFKKKSSAEHRDLLNFCWLIILIYVILYFIFPYKVAYLIPVIPWGLIVLNEKFKKTFTIILCILLLLNSIAAIETTNDGAAPSVKLDSGVVIKNYNDRKSSSIEQSKEYIESLSNLHGKF